MTAWQLEFEKVAQRCGYLLTSRQWSDCTFVVGSETNQAVVQAHKLVLTTASPVFEAMFYGGLSENNELTIHIPDVQPEAFRALLQYIYTGDINIDSLDMASDLWYGAEKYMLPHLVNECNSYIWLLVGPSNVCRAYEIACFFEEKTLMDKCVQIICTNTKEVLSGRTFEDVELNTVITVLSFNYLTVDSELDLFHAVARYAETELKRQRQIIPPVDGELPSEKLSESLGLSKVLQSVESSSQTSPAAELDSKITSVVTSEPADKENLKKERERLAPAGIRAAIEKIRFLTLTPQQFAEGPARSGLLTEGESFAVLMNIASADCSVSMPTGFSECRERRQQPTDATQVDEESNAKPCRKPSTEYLSGAAIKLPTPAVIVHGLLSHERKTLEHAARAARHMTCADADGSSENLTQLVAAGAIPPLVTALHHSRPSVQYDAAWGLTNIACVGEHAVALVNADAVPALVGLLGRGGAVAEQAAWALGNIAGSGDNASDAVMDAGAGAALLAHMQLSTPSGPLATYLRTYRILCQRHVQSFWTRSELVPAVTNIENLLVSADEQVLTEACWVLYHMVDGGCLKQELFTASFARRLTALMGHAAPRVHAAALWALGNILRLSQLRDPCLEAGCLDQLINFLKCGNPSQVEYAAYVAVEVLYTPRHREQALRKGILYALGTALTEGNFSCKVMVSRAFGIFINYSSESQVSVLAEVLMEVDGLLADYCQLLAPADTSEDALVGCENTLLSLCDLLKKVEENTQPALILKLREIGVPQLVIPLQQDKNEWNRKRAVFFLKTYFPEELRRAQNCRKTKF